MKFLLFLVLTVPLVAAATDTLYETTSDPANNLPVGPMTQEQILAFNVFDYWYVQYSPKADPVEVIHNYPNPLEVKVIFGDWSADSKKHVPAFIKVMEIAGNSRIRIGYINIARHKEDRAGQLGSLEITGVPTMIVFSGDNEIGRIVEAPKVSVEQDLADMLAASLQPPQTQQ